MIQSKSLRSFSFGIVFAVSIIGSYHYYAVNENNKQITESEAKKQLEATGFVVLKATEYKDLKKIQEESKNKKVETKVNNPEKAADQNNEGTTGKKENENEVTAYTLYIVSGMSSSEIASLLASQKIVANKEEFEQYLISNNFHTKIQLGTFEVNSKMSYAEIAKILTKS